MPYQEEPRDVPLRFEVAVPQDAARTHLLPIVLAGSVKGRDDAKATYDRVLANARPLYEGNVAYYRGLAERTMRIETPDARLDDAFAWAKAGIDKGLVENPLLGTGFVAGFRTSGDSERPGFAWHFGRDTLWTVPAVLAYGDFETARAGLDFLRKFQRADGKIPHEVSQAASLVPWFTDYKYPYESADATPLYVIAHAEHFAVTRRPGVPARVVAVDRECLALHGGDGHRRQRARREREVRARLDGGQPAVSAARGDLPAGRVDRGVPASRGSRRRHRAREVRERRPRLGGAHAGRGREDVLARRARVLRVRDGPCEA